MGNNDTLTGCLGTALATVGFFGLYVVLALIFAWPAQLLWNWLVPVIFAGPKITLWQALGLEILTGIFFRSGGTVSKNG
mgnify:CR=1 FL=1